MISIIICTFNGASRIQNCLDSILSQKRSQEYELIIVDNASIDDTFQSCKSKLERESPICNWKIIQEPNSGLIHARLAGLKNAKFEWILFCDDDNVLKPDYLENAVKIISDLPSNIGVLGSLGIPKFEAEKPFWFDKYSSSFAVGPQLDSIWDSTKLNHVYGACALFRKKPLMELFGSGFHPIMTGRKGNESISGDDVEWCWLMQLKGYDLQYSKTLKFYHIISSNRLNWEYYLKLKKGINFGGALLYSYQYYFKNPKSSEVAFQISYLLRLSKIYLLFYKYKLKWMGKELDGEERLVQINLESSLNSFIKFKKESLFHFRQLKSVFG